MLQEQALNLLKLGKNIFLTGAAGAGKTYVLNKYIEYLKRHDVVVAVTASTGIAATHLQGMTIHSWSGIGIKDDLDDKDLLNLKKNSRIKRHYEEAKVLIIDEISMLHPHQLDMVDQVAKTILKSAEPFGGMQVIFCGDFFQLPPVSNVRDIDEKSFAFESIAWQNADVHVCYLEEQHRQSNDELLTVLNDIRSGTAGEHTKLPLRTRYKKEPAGDIKPTKLYSRNINVDSINERELNSIDKDEEYFEMETKGHSKLVEGLKKSCLAPYELRVKVGAQVMFIKNDPLGRFVNGTRGIVVGYHKEHGWPVVRTVNNKTVTAYPEDWKFEDNGKITARLSQVPLRLAWAITIHKSQGMTLDAAEMDLGDTFEPGMGYVALSRVRTLDGLKLMNLNDMALRVHPKILDQDKNFKRDSQNTVKLLEDMDTIEIEEQQSLVLSERFQPESKPAKKKRRYKDPDAYLLDEL